MRQFSSLVWSSVGKKILTGITGLALCLFIIEHLTGNLLLLHSDGEPFNKYAHTLHSLGEILIVLELGLAAVFIGHMIVGVRIAMDKEKSRPREMRYYRTANAGKPSRKTWGSVSMIVTGIVLFIFLIIHLKMFRFGPGIEQGYVTQIDGKPAVDLYRLVDESFQNIWVVIGYVAVMLLLGLHFSHGFWSAFQSLGVNHPRYTPVIYTVGIVFAVVMAVGFLFLPIWIYFRGGA